MLSEKNIDVELYNEEGKEYEIIKEERRPVIFNEPVIWDMIIKQGDIYYNITYQTPEINLNVHTNKSNGSWIQNISLTTDYDEVYEDINLEIATPKTNKLNISPNFEYDRISDNNVNIHIPELFRKQEILICDGNFQNINSTSENITLLLNISLNTTLINLSFINESLVNETLLNLTLNLTQNFSEDKIFLETFVLNSYFDEQESWPIVLEIDNSERNPELGVVLNELETDQEMLTDLLLDYGIPLEELGLNQISKDSRTNLFSEESLRKSLSIANLQHIIKMSGSDKFDLIEQKHNSVLNNKKRIEQIQGNQFNGELNFDEFVIKNIRFNELFIENSTINLGLKELNATSSDISEIGETLNKNPVQSYAIDPENLNFTNATVTVVAKGTELYKCKEWDFANDACLGEWELFKDDLVIGEEYTFILTPNDPAFIEVVETDTCSAEDYEYTSGTFADVCDYSDGSSLYDGGTIETHTYGADAWWGSRAYAGIKIESHDDSVTNCNNIESVEFCYEWWITTNQGQTGNCRIRIDSDDGSSYTTLSTSCPGMTSNPGVTCVDVTSLENWDCDNFFGSSSDVATAYGELTVASSGMRAKTETMVVDVWFFNVTYNATNNAPYWSNNKTTPNSGITYLQGRDYFFNVTWEDEYGVDEVWIEHNFTGSLANYSVDTYSGDEYSYNYSNLAAGTYSWKMYANDSDSFLNQTPTWNYFVDKAPSILSLLFNGSYENATIYQGEYVNITSKATQPEDEFIYLYMNGSLINSGNETLTNITLFEDIGKFNITVTVSSSENYSANSKSLFVTVQNSSETIPPQIIITSPENGTTTKATLVNLIATTDEQATCRFSNESTFSFINGTLFDTTGSYTHSEQLISPSPGNHTYYVKCNDTKGNINNETTQKSITFYIDRTPPNPVTDLINVSKGFDWIYWTWTNPTDGDFNNTKIFIDAELVAELNSSYNSYNATDLIPSTNYTINVQTKDVVGNVNTAYVANTTSTMVDSPPTINSVLADPSTSYFGQEINFSANVTDDYGVDSVWLSVEGQNYSMVNTSGDGMYYYNDYEPPTTSKVYSYTVYANDSYGQSSKISTFIVINTEQTTYYEHSASYILNTSTYAESLQENMYSFSSGTETLAWTFDMDSDFGNGGALFNIGNIQFSGGFKASGFWDENNVYINWQLMEVTASSDEIEICRTPTGTSGQLVTSSSYDILDSTCALNEEYYLAPNSTLKLNIYGYRSGGVRGRIYHGWDTSTTGSAIIVDQLPIGLLDAQISYPENNDQFMANKTHFNITCEIDCLNGSCLGNTLIIQGRENSTSSWYNLSNTTTPIRVNHTYGHPTYIGDVVSKVNESVLLLGTQIFNDAQLRCFVIDKYNQSTLSDTVYVDIIPPDNEAPTLTNISNESITDSSAYIKWNTNEDSNSFVIYGPTLALGYTEPDSDFVQIHSILLDELNPITTYFYKVKSCDSYNNCNESTIFNFTTTEAPDLDPPIISNIDVTEYPYSAIVSWDTDEGANSTVQYGLTAALGSTRSSASYVTDHSISLPNLLEETTYYYKISSCDSSGNCANTSIHSFATTSDNSPVIHSIRPSNNSNHLQNFNVDIKVNVTDDDEVDSVYMNITYSGGSSYFELTDGNSDGEYTYLFTSTGTIGMYNMSVKATDNHNQNTTSYGYFNIIAEVTPPTVFDLRPVAGTYYSANTNIEIAANATDSSGVDDVLAYINWSAGSETITLINGVGDFYNNSFTNTSTEGRYDVTFIANDTNNNINNVQTTYFYINDTNAPLVAILSPSPSGKTYNQSDSVGIIAYVYDVVGVDKVYANLTWNNQNNNQLVQLNRQGLTYNYTGTFTNTTLGGVYNITILANDTSGNINNSEKTWFNVSQNTYDITILDIVFPSNLIEGENVNIQVNISNNNIFNTDNFNVKLNISFWNGSKIFNETLISSLVNLSGSESKLVNFNWETKIGTYIFDAEADTYNVITETDETNNTRQENITVSAWEIFYGNYSYNLKLGSYNNDTYLNWTPTTPQGNLYYYDYDSSFYPFNLEPLNQSGDIAQADSALGLTGFNDSLARLFDRNSDGLADDFITIEIAGSDVANIPIINSTSGSDFFTGILYDSADGIGYDGTQDLVFITIINFSATGKYGQYDYEARIPAKLDELKAGTDLVHRMDEPK